MQSIGWFLILLFAVVIASAWLVSTLISRARAGGERPDSPSSGTVLDLNQGETTDFRRAA